jgi:hypothetical protein
LFEQGRHRCSLAGTVADRPVDEAEDDALCIACAEWANFEPVVGKPKVHQETCFFTEYCTHFFEGDPHLSDLSGSRWYQEASPFRRSVVERFCAGICKFANPPTLLPLSEGWERAAVYVAKVAASRRFQVSDGANLWSHGVPYFVSPPYPKVATAPGHAGSWHQLGLCFSTGAEFSEARRGRNGMRAFPRREGTLTMFMPFLEDSSQTFT